MVNRHVALKVLVWASAMSRDDEQRLANTLVVERTYAPDRKSMLAALRVVLGLPKAPPGRIEELRR